VIPLRDQEMLRQRLARDLTSRVRIDYFSQRPSPIFIAGRQECVYCEDVRKLLDELAALSPRIALTKHDIEDDATLAKELGVDKAPGTVIRGMANRPVRYFGMPSGNPFLGFVETLIDAARGPAPLGADAAKTLRRLKSDVTVQVFVLPACTYSPLVARAAVRLALHSVRVKTSIIEVAEYPEIVQRYRIPGVPLTVVNDAIAITGAMNDAVLAQNLLLIAEGKQAIGGNSALVTPLPRPQESQQTTMRTSPSGLIIPGRG
jgi:glutaredoxin-like protein